MESKKQQAEAIIKVGVEDAIKVGLIPLPFLDVYLVLKRQIEMLKELCDLYEAPYSQVKTEALVTTVISGGVLWRYGGSMAKFLPFTGWAVGMATMSVVSGASTYALGKLAVRYLEEDGTLDNAGGKKAKNIIEDAMTEGAVIVEEIKETLVKEEVEEEANEELDTQALEAEMLIEKLEQLRDSGVLTEKEFAIKKKKVDKMMNGKK